MSNRIKLREYTPSNGSTISLIRKRVTGRTTRLFEHNIQKKTIYTHFWGKIPLKMSVKDFKTITVKYKFFETFLLHTKNAKLTADTLALKEELLQILSKELSLGNVYSALSHKNAAETKLKMEDYIEKSYMPSSFQ